MSRFKACGQMSMGGWLGVWGDYTVQLVPGPYRYVKKKPSFGKLGPFDVLIGDEPKCWWLKGPGASERFASLQAAEAWVEQRSGVTPDE